ncbi:hypothetical protein GRI97_17315 [Altererythrobacter xixiisoli]|uniref:Uncharacterized protein n=1 Tax=Croceibacterium xixiisoli TaxID=1476466 RepID=A0A6I4TXT4_9SPHN|nr:DUF6180 family protein [Croceibacterium xixiisoli]MXP00753.1 hypothetical protein [Croceibacterium xixiisoli]
MRKNFIPAVAAIAALSAAGTTPAVAAGEQFGLSYHVDRLDTTKLSVADCLTTAQQASTALGYATTVRQLHPNQLGVLASGPRNGGASLTVYCIAVDRKTAVVVQALDHQQANSAAAQRVADNVRQAVLRAGR